MKKPVIAIIANGEPPTKTLVKQLLPEVDLIIAADGGANSCVELGLKPNYIVGDLDSVTEETKRFFPDATTIPMIDQNFRDLEKTIAFALTRNPQRLIIFAAFGRRSDHTFSNLLVAAALDTDVPVEILDDWGRLTWLKSGNHQLSGIPGNAVSLFSINPVQQLFLEGFKYNLSNEDFEPFFNGTSNQFSATIAHIKFMGGPMFVYVPFTEKLKS